MKKIFESFKEKIECINETFVLVKKENNRYWVNIEKKPKNAKEIKDLPFVDEIFKEEGSWWVYLKPGFIASTLESGTIHEYSLRDVISEIMAGIEYRPDEDINKGLKIFTIEE